MHVPVLSTSDENTKSPFLSTYGRDDEIDKRHLSLLPAAAATDH